MLYEVITPLTLFGLDRQYRYAVIEMGANHPGEISWLSHIARPSVAVITQCAPAHLEGFGSVAGVARAKAEIYEGLEPEGIAVINNDDEFAPFWYERTENFQSLGFGIRITSYNVCYTKLLRSTERGVVCDGCEDRYVRRTRPIHDRCGSLLPDQTSRICGL